jgi:ferrochelatase
MKTIKSLAFVSALADLIGMAKLKTGVLLMNLGTPEAPTAWAVGKYLREFLSDPYVIDIPPALRWALVHFVILPFRSAASAKAYRTVWTEEGSPLLFHTRGVCEQVRELQAAAGVQVEWAMRYGKPSIDSAVQRLVSAGVQQVLLVPLYPQYSLAATESSLDWAKRCFQKRAPDVAIHSLRISTRSPRTWTL